MSCSSGYMRHFPDVQEMDGCSRVCYLSVTVGDEEQALITITGGNTPMFADAFTGRRRTLRRAVISLGALVALWAVAGCDDDGPTTVAAVDDAAGAGSSNGDVVTVQALDNTFRGDEITIDVGTEVRWENVGLNQHDVVASDGSGAWGVTKDEFYPGDSYSAIFAAPGEYRYYCSLHGTETSGMIGTIIVEDS